jgi:hypothetical protein
MKKQTAVEWLVGEIKSKYSDIDFYHIKKEIEQAKEMEKKQSLYSFFAGYNYEGAFPVDEHEEYYKEPYGK